MDIPLAISGGMPYNRSQPQWYDPERGGGDRAVKRTLVLVLAGLMLLLAGCSPEEKDRLGEYELGEQVSTYWFDFIVEKVEPVDSYDGYHPSEGNRLVVYRLSLENTFNQTVTMVQTDFFLLWPDEEEGEESSSRASLGGMVGSYALPKFSESQMEDTYDLTWGGRAAGDLVFEIPQEVDRAALVYEEYYVDEESETGYSAGDHYAVWFSLEEPEGSAP